MRKHLFLTASLTIAALTGPSVAQTAPVVAVRTGVHETYDRVVFDWPKNVKYKLNREGAKASITFEAAASIKFPHTIQYDLSRAHGFSAQEENGAVTVTFTIDPYAPVKVFENASSIVIDIQDKIKDAPKRTEVPESAAPTPQSGEAPKNAATDKPLALLPEPPAKTDPIATEKPPTPPPPPSAAAQPVPPAAKNLPDLVLTENPIQVAALDPHILARAVIFSRAGGGYIVFDKKMTLSPQALLNGTSSLIDLQPLDMPKNSGFRFDMPPESTVQATLDKTTWKLFLSKKQDTFSVTTSLIAQPDFALGARLLLPLPDAPDPIRFTDPVVGDDLVLVPLAQSQAFNVERRIPNLAILSAAQGLVIKPLSEKVVVRAVSDGVEITAEGGLLLSRASDTGANQESASKLKAAATGKSMFDFATWKGKPGETFTQTRQRLQQTIVDVPEAERNRARMELARFYFSKGLGGEAVSMLEYIAKQVPDLKFHDDFMALLGAAKILAYRSEDGLRDLAIPGLADQPEVALWQAVGLAQIREWKEAEDRFLSKESLLAGYPEPFFSRFFVLAIESALAAGHTHEAADWLHFVMNSPHSTSIDPALAFLRGAIEAKAGHEAEARKAWKEAKSSNDRLYKVRAELAMVDLDVSMGSLTPAQAADRLETMRFAWRGDDLEAEILHRLGQFYIRAKNVKAGIAMMSKAATLFPSGFLAPTVRTEMAAAFRNVFLGAKEQLSPLDALTLYRQYRDILPPGKERDEILAHLAERLVAVDLLDQAAALLEELAKTRLLGDEKARAVSRIAAIRLLDHKPDEALSALAILSDNEVPSSMQNERTLLKARAFFELNKVTEANALLKDNTSVDTIMLRADMATREQKWPEAAKTLMTLVGQPPAQGLSLSPEKAGWLVNAAIAYALANDQVSLDKLAIDYAPAMEKNVQNATFLMLTRPEKTGQLRDLAAAQTQLSQVDIFQGFLNNYRKGVSVNAGEK
ncbi:MAG: hypothetical protein PHW76_00345 [Alphaproteobacteria bacterium]|nr:hypothetical protein [Alphaproteobacteria bacterium]